MRSECHVNLAMFGDLFFFLAFRFKIRSPGIERSCVVSELKCR